MRILIVDTYYPAILAEHYRARPELARASYDEQLAALMQRDFGTADAYSAGLRDAGHDAADLIVNAAPLQRRWAAEHGVRLPPPLPVARAERIALRRIALRQIAEYAPDVVYVQDLWFFTPADLRALRKAGRRVVGQIASASPPDAITTGYELILTSFPHFVERYERLGVASEYLAIAYDARLHERLRASGADPSAAAPRPRGAVFVGGVDPAVHAAGTRTLERLARDVELEVWGYGADRLAPGSPLRSRHRGQAWGLEMHRVFASARVVVNRHIDAAEGYANNMRLFEATGDGAALITEAAPNLHELYAPGAEVATYRDEDELAATVRRLLADEDERRVLAEAGQRRTLADHTYALRMRELAAILERRL